MKIAFIDRDNSTTSLMAEAVARKLFMEAGMKADIFSAGVEPSERVHPLTLSVLEKRGYSTKGLYPKPVSKIPYKKLDVVVVMCNEARERCEFVVSHKRRENWNIEEPEDRETSFIRTLETIEEHIKSLLKI